MYNELYHHGIKGQKWGIRRFQNADGSLTSKGSHRYNVNSGNKSRRSSSSNNKKGKLSTGKKVAIGVAATAAVLGTAYAAKKITGIKYNRAAEEFLRNSDIGTHSISSLMISDINSNGSTVQKLASMNRDFGKSNIVTKAATKISDHNFSKQVVRNERAKAKEAAAVARKAAQNEYIQGNINRTQTHVNDPVAKIMYESNRYLGNSKDYSYNATKNRLKNYGYEYDPVETKRLVENYKTYLNNVNRRNGYKWQ